MKTFNPSWPDDLRNSGLIDRPPLNKKVAKKIVEYISEGKDLKDMPDDELNCLVRQAHLACGEYAILYGYEKEEK